jgi:hypothetical protein
MACAGSVPIVADLVIDETELVVRLNPLEKLGAFRGNVHVPLTDVMSVRVSEDQWSELRGMRAPGTGIPGVIALCTRRAPGVRDFAAVYGRRRKAVVVECSGVDINRIVVTRSDADEKAKMIVAAAGGELHG